MSSTDSGTWQVVTTDEEFLSLRDEWDELFLSNPRHRPFQAWGWVVAWLKYLAGPHELSIICRRTEAGRLEFVLPLVISSGNGQYGSPRIMSVCGYGPECSDHASCLRAPSLDAQMAELAAESMTRFCDVTLRVELGNLDSAGQYADHLSAAIRADNRTVRLTEFATCPVVQLPDSWDSFLQQFSSNFRSQTRRHHKRIDTHSDLQFRSVPASESAQFAEDLMRLNRNRIGVKGRVSSLEDPDFRDFLRAAIPCLAEKGLAWLDVVEEHGRTIAAALNLVHGNRVYYYMGGFDSDAGKIRPGTALFARVIMRSIENGYTEYDFLRGDDAYKYRWGATDAYTYRLDVYPRSLTNGRASLLADELYDATRTLVRRIRSSVKKAH